MQDKAKPDDIDQLKDVEVGEILRRTREHYGQSLKDVENILRIRASQIDAIEKGMIASLPGRVYAIGFVRSYAEYLGLDGAKVVQLFKAQYMDPQPREALSFPVPASESKTPPVWLALLGLVLLVAVFVFWGYMQAQGRQSATVIEPVPKKIQERITQKVVTPAPQPEQGSTVSAFLGENMGQTPSDQHKGIILNINDNSWVEIKGADGKVLVSDVLKKGDQYFVPDSPGLSMSLGNAGGIEIKLNGRALKPLGKEGVVMRDIPLDTSHLKTLEFKEEEKVAEEAPKETKPEGKKASAKKAETQKKPAEAEN